MLTRNHISTSSLFFLLVAAALRTTQGTETTIPWSATSENWHVSQALVLSYPESGTLQKDPFGGILYRNDNSQVPFDRFSLAIESDQTIAVVNVDIDKSNNTVFYEFNGITTKKTGGNDQAQGNPTPENGTPALPLPTSTPLIGSTVEYATTIGGTVHATVVGLPGNAPIPQGGSIQIFITDVTVENDANLVWEDIHGYWFDLTGSLHEGVANWSDISDGLATLREDSVDTIVISGHSTSAGGIVTSGPDLTPINLDDQVISVIRDRASSEAVIVLLGCQLGNAQCLEGIQELSNALGMPIIVNQGEIKSGTFGTGIWVKVIPNE